MPGEGLEEVEWDRLPGSTRLTGDESIDQDRVRAGLMRGGVLKVLFHLGDIARVFESKGADDLGATGQFSACHQEIDRLRPMQLDRPDQRDPGKGRRERTERLIDEETNELNARTDSGGKPNCLIEVDRAGRGRVKVEPKIIRSGLDTGQSVGGVGHAADFDEGPGQLKKRPASRAPT